MTESASNLTAVVLAGGSGQRFWRLSRELSPKQLLAVSFVVIGQVLLKSG